MSVVDKRRQIQRGNGVSIAQQCATLGLARSSYYYQPVGESDYNLDIPRQLPCPVGVNYLGRLIL